MSNPLEIFDIVDDDNVIVGQAPRGECHGNPCLVHRAVHVLVFNPQGALLLQKRPVTKDIQPGKWDTSVGGHLDQGESFLAAAKREMQEELGLSGIPLTFLYPSKIRNDIESENVETFLAVTEQAVTPAPDEVDEVRYWQSWEIDSAVGTGVFTPNFEEEWLMFKEFSRKYQVSEIDRVGLCPGDSLPNLLRRLSEE